MPASRPSRARSTAARAALLVACLAILSCNDRAPRAARPVGRAAAPVLATSEPCPSCTTSCFQVSDRLASEDLRSSGVRNLTHDVGRGGLVLAGNPAGTSSRYAVVASAEDDTVMRVDLEAGTQVGLHLVGLEGETNSPSRVALDSQGYAYVLSQAPGGQGSVTKLAGSPDQCVDEDDDGTVETWDPGVGGPPLDRGADECVLWTVPVGGADDLARAAAVDAAGRLWVGLWTAGEFLVVDTRDGSIDDTVEVCGHPYAAAVDGHGSLWYADRGWYTEGGSNLPEDERGGIQRIDTSDPHGGAPACPDAEGWVDLYEWSGCFPHGLAIDASGRVVVGAAPCSRVFRYDPVEALWEEGDLGVLFETTGVAVAADGDVWAVAREPAPGTGQGMAARLSNRRLRILDTYLFGTESAPIGVQVDELWRAWVTDRGEPSIVRIDPSTDSVVSYGLTSPSSTHGDFTGYVIGTYTATEGAFVRLFDRSIVCDPGDRVEWRTLVVHGEALTGSELTIEAGVADTPVLADEAVFAQLGIAPPIAESYDLVAALSAIGESPSRRVLVVRVTLSAPDGGAGPVLSGLDVTAECTR